VVNPLTGTGINPKWDFTSSGTTAGNPNAFVTAAKVSSVGAPTGSQDIDWVDLKNLVGSLAQQVYRTDTRLGQPPASVSKGFHHTFEVSVLKLSFQVHPWLSQYIRQVFCEILLANSPFHIVAAAHPSPSFRFLWVFSVNTNGSGDNMVGQSVHTIDLGYLRNHLELYFMYEVDFLSNI